MTCSPFNIKKKMHKKNKQIKEKESAVVDD
jgi:hypothetical protein